ncbi:hypothetical protein PM082_018109 [Marasmius tenuissimus]|nr:hypothetical protein PM082_018109 [Marasmius tenuissimus]
MSPRLPPTTSVGLTFPPYRSYYIQPHTPALAADSHLPFSYLITPILTIFPVTEREPWKDSWKTLDPWNVSSLGRGPWTLPNPHLPTRYYRRCNSNSSTSSPRSQGHIHNETLLVGSIHPVGISHLASSRIVVGGKVREREFMSVDAERPSMPTSYSGSVYGLDDHG